jgi:hypothetical protein
MSTVAHMPVISPDPETAKRTQDRLVAERAVVEIVYEAAWRDCLAAVFPESQPRRRDHLSVVK